MKQKKNGYIGWAMRNHNIVFILVSVFVLFGVYALLNMPRNEFPNFTIRQGLVVGVYPGATSAEVEEQLTKEVENYIFGFKEVKKAKTYSESKEGMMIIYVELNDNVKNADEFWSKLKHGLNELKQTLPPGVVALIGNNDFGDTSALLITLSSDTKNYKELENELKRLKAECRKISSVSKIKDYGIQKEKIYVNVAPEKLNEYNVKSISLLSSYMSNGTISPAGKLKNGANDLYVHFPANFESEKDLSDQIVFADPKGGVVRLKDIAQIERRNQDPDSYIRQDGKKTILLSLEMQQGNNIVQFGKDVDKALAVFQKQCPKDIKVTTISNLPKYVDKAVSNFMREFLIAIIAVIAVVLLLLPKRVAAIAGLTVPIAVLITLGFLFFFGVELNTVSLAGLIIVLGMIVDNAIVVIDNYVEKKDHGMSSWHAAIKSARELVTPIITATLAICIVYIPLGSMLPGTAGDFVRDLPITICIALVISIIVALFVVPFLNFFFIKKGLVSTDNNQPSKKSFLDIVQTTFDRALEKAFRNPKITIGIGIGSVLLAIVLFKGIDQQLFPSVERNQFAVEVYLPKGASLESTSEVIDSLENALKKDSRVTAVTSFIGTSSPRFHTMYAPNMPGSNFGQLLVNTTDNDATEKVCEEYNKKFEGAFPNAHVKWKILAMQLNKYPIEIRISGDSTTNLRKVEAQVYSIIKPVKGIKWVRTDWEQKQQNIEVQIDKDKATRMGYSKGFVATSLMVGLDGIPLTTIWENDYPVEVRLSQDNGQAKNIDYLGNQYITSPMSFSAVPLRSFAKFTPQWTEGTIAHRNGTRTLTVQIDVDPKVMASNVLGEIRPQVDKLKLPEGVSINYGGDAEGQVEVMLPMAFALLISIVVIFFILLFQFKKVKLVSLIMSTMLLGLPGAAIGLTLMGFPFGLTAFIGITSLCGIVVRNGIILIDYLQELRIVHGMSVGEAALAAGKRRMRPIFLTSAAASVGVIPMILSRSTLWGPLGTVICFGLLISMVLTLFILPVLYTIIYKDKAKRVKKHIPYSNIASPAIVLLIVVASLLPTKSEAQARALSIDSCKTLAVSNNKKIKDAVFDTKSSLEVKKSAFTNYFPKVSATGLAMRSSDYLIKGKIPSMNLPVYDGNPASLAAPTLFTYVPEIPINMFDYLSMASISVTQPVFVGGKIINGNKLAKIGYEVSKQKKELTTTQVLVKTEELYWGTISLQQKLTTISSYEKLLDNLNKDVSIAVKAGLAQRSDLLKVELKQNELAVNKLKLKNGITISTRALCQHIGIKYDSTIVFSMPLVASELPEQYYTETTSAVSNRIEYKMLNNAIKAEKLQKKMALGDCLPQVALSVMGYSADFMNKTSTNALAAVSVNVPISDWWSGKHKMKEAQFKVEQANNKLDETTELLALQIEQTKNELNETYTQISISQKSIEQAKENLKVVNDNYKAGVSSMSDLLEAQALYQDTQNQYTDAVCTYKIKIANYRSAIGKYE
jgi:multidrug efflux pump subunit AcrB/outer membrane protein TolC